MSVVHRLRVEVVEMELPILLFQLGNVALSCMIDDVGVFARMREETEMLL